MLGLVHWKTLKIILRRSETFFNVQRIIIITKTHTDMAAKIDIKAIRKFVDDSYGITCAKLIDTDCVKLAQKYLLAVSIGGNPRFAKADAERLGITF